MGREIRRVVPNWEHPKRDHMRFIPGEGYKTVEEFAPMHDRDFKTALRQWLFGYTMFGICKKFPRITGALFDWGKKKAKVGSKLRRFVFWHLHDLRGERDMEYWDWDGGPPDPAYHRPRWKKGEATWYQMYETVSEGTPVTPPFPTKMQLVNHLVHHGTFWDSTPWSPEAAKRFVDSEWAPSFIVDNTGIKDVRQQNEARVAEGES
jgi:hypothetical protein